MPQTKLISILVVAVVVVGAAYAAFMPKSVDHKTIDAPAQVEPVATQPAQEASGKKIPFADFIKNGGAYKCTVHQNVGGVETEGLTYINDKMIRGEYMTKMQGMNMGTTLIVRDGYTYSWTSMMPNMGFKAKVVESTPDTTADMSGTYSFNAQQIGDYDCQPWTVDASKFTLPEGVTFTEVKPKQ